MLQDLDRRNAMGSANGPVPPQQVRAVGRPGAGHEWFWRTLALLSAAAVGWVGWVAYQMQPRSIVTEMTLTAALQPRAKPAAAPAPQVAAAPEKPAPAPESPVAAPKAPV